MDGMIDRFLFLRVLLPSHTHSRGSESWILKCIFILLSSWLGYILNRFSDWKFFMFFLDVLTATSYTSADSPPESHQKDSPGVVPRSRVIGLLADVRRAAGWPEYKSHSTQRLADPTSLKILLFQEEF
jgi:hypothetical protein